MRHVTLVFALVLALAVGIPVTTTHPAEGPVLTLPGSEPSIGPYADPNG